MLCEVCELIHALPEGKATEGVSSLIEEQRTKMGKEKKEVVFAWTGISG